MLQTLSAPNATPIRVVIVTMDTHFAGALERARTELTRELPGLSLVLHAASEWSADPSALDRCRADIAAGDIIVCGMLFMEDHFLPILTDLEARRDDCDAMVLRPIGARGGAVDARRPFQDGRLRRRRAQPPQEAAWRQEARRRGRLAPDGHAAAAAAYPPPDSRHGAGRARLLPDPAILARRLAGEPRQHGTAAGPAATPTVRVATCATSSRPRRPSNIPMSVSITRA